MSFAKANRSGKRHAVKSARPAGNSVVRAAVGYVDYSKGGSGVVYSGLSDVTGLDQSGEKRVHILLGNLAIVAPAGSRYPTIRSSSQKYEGRFQPHEELI